MTALSGAALCSAWDLWKWQPPRFSTASNSLREAFTCLSCGKVLILSLFYLVIFSFFSLPLWSSPSVMYSFFPPCSFCSPCTFPQSLEQCVSCLHYGELPLPSMLDGKHPVVSLGVLSISIDILLTHGISLVFCSVKCASCLVSCHIEVFSLLFFFLHTKVWQQNQ